RGPQPELVTPSRAAAARRPESYRSTDRVCRLPGPNPQAAQAIDLVLLLGNGACCGSSGLARHGLLVGSLSAMRPCHNHLRREAVPERRKMGGAWVAGS